MGVRRQGIESVARPLRSEYVTGTYFSTLGVRAFGGRVFTPEDDKPAAPPVAVLSHRVWQTAYASDPSVVGSTDRKSTRLNSSHVAISYAVFCLKKKITR